MKEFEDYIRSLSDAECDMAEDIEAELATLLTAGQTDEVAFKFVRLVMMLRKLIPEATVSGTWEAVFLAGIQRVGSLAGNDLKTQSKRKSNTQTWTNKLSGKGTR